MKSRSIVRQLLTSILSILLILWISLVISVAWVLKHETDEIFDFNLQETAQRLLPLAVMQIKQQDEKNKYAFEINRDSLEPAKHEEYMVYQVFSASGHMHLRSHAAPTFPLVTELKQGFHRTADYLVYVEKSRNGEFLLALAEKHSHRTDTLLSTLQFLLMPLLILLPLSTVSMLKIARTASKPLQKLDTELAKRGGSDLDPISTYDLPQEIQPLVKTLNQLMVRLKSALEFERNFAANSAHELRTPLAAATAQLRVLEKTILNDEQRKPLLASQKMLQRLQSLSEKLLQLARAESGIAWKSEAIDLTELLRLICDDHQWRTVLHLQLRQPTSPLIVQGDMDALGIVLSNLLENAIKYASPRSSIQIEMRTSPIQISITNDCDPLPKTKLERLHERFYRAHADSQGSGLGLSIVDTLLKPTSIAFSIRSPATGSHRGFEVNLTWL